MTKPSGKNNLVDLILATKGLEGIEDEIFSLYIVLLKQEV